MGSFLSIQSGEKQRRSNRLSKPPSTFTSRSPSCRSPLQTSGASSPVAPKVAPWQEYSTTTSSPIRSWDLESKGQRPQSVPSVSLRTEALWTGTSETRKSPPMSREPNELRLHSDTSNTPGPLCRRASFQPTTSTAFRSTTLRSESGQLRRSYSVHSPPHSTRGAIHQSSLEEATSSNTHFMVDSPGFSLIRRRSLLTRPGIATRRSVRDSSRRCPSPIGQELGFSFNHTDEPKQPSQWPLTSCVDSVLQHTTPLAQFRPPTPSDFEYTHLGTLKLGSLRVVNGSASPCPSDRSRLRPYSPTPEASTAHMTELRRSRDHLAHVDPPGVAALDRRDHRSVIENSWDPETVPMPMYNNPEGSSNVPSSDTRNMSGLSKSKPSTSILQIPSFPDVIGHEDFPASPFSFEKSPTITIPHGFYVKEMEDEGVSVSDDEKALGFGRKASRKGSHPNRLSHSHRKVDSGYSSATSVRSLQDNRTRDSIDSQESAQRPPSHRRFTLGGSREPEMCNVRGHSGPGNQLPMDRHLSLQGPRIGPRCDSHGRPTNMFTMCHETPSLPAAGRPRSLSLTSPQDSSRTVSFSRYCNQLRHSGTASSGTSPPSAHRPVPTTIQTTDNIISNNHRYEGLTTRTVEPSNVIGQKELKTTNQGKPGADLESDQPHKSNLRRSKSAKKLVKKTPNAVHDQDPQTIGANAAVQCLEAEIVALLTPPSQLPVKNVDVHPESLRGRARSRAIDFERRMTVKQQKHPSIKVAAPPPSLYH
ncbi:uncharacterized protein BDW43DRAFT_155621 [Aspergillus alliaceus]|uniref:uncharacterized protein n=1 Tax=Petromyces alliaceus TaxID=209559 RepID=UPI0012A501AE|nr:uncharacterized protein BDW43DRAFT_155621 [Aspergillus alliaceus]KAB8230665.1 hypothetical protein BDW43DRAFT_155621 [Aspergillus alliaceus]